MADQACLYLYEPYLTAFVLMRGLGRGCSRKICMGGVWLSICMKYAMQVAWGLRDNIGAFRGAKHSPKDRSFVVVLCGCVRDLQSWYDNMCWPEICGTWHWWLDLFWFEKVRFWATLVYHDRLIDKSFEAALYELWPLVVSLFTWQECD